jgi:molybdopterin synthase catalytic subunit
MIPGRTEAGMNPQAQPPDDFPATSFGDGGTGLTVALTREPIAVDRLAARLVAPDCGAVVTFTGTVRDHHQGRRVRGLSYDAYEAMALPLLEEIAAGARERYALSRVVVVHRLGDMAVGEASVFLGVASPHREESFAACRFLIDAIKAQVPIWKKEYYDDGSAWIEGDVPAGP